ncbi:PR domain zinc finger protein 1-like [Anoplophora glabripennis]|uniref:PR domain zinc finger protein 1-like n=1 Tax=Anoplophora glabripennis TaxID=217634 RepID=UPI00087561D5|nr:PR domain zinc finger protein 1-like [Anoplophora glabripennis]
MKLNKCVRLLTEKHLENMGSMFKTLYNDELLTDCTLHCKNGSIRAHKVILAASSPYFRKVFLEHKDERAIFIMHGISLEQLRDLLELIYKGAIDVPSETLNTVYELAEELELTGVLLEEGSSDTKCNGYGRDTRYRGQKRVAVDFTSEDNEVVPEKIVKNSAERRVSSCSEKGISSIKKCETSETVNNETPTELEDTNNVVSRTEVTSKERLMGHPVDEQSNLSVWARKERKFKCDLCPSSFKRASHLTRHQLVHTGERPFACTQCDKAFSRHDKLKHHIHKAHELPALNEALPADSLYTIGHVRILTPEQTMIETSEPVVHSPLSSPTPAPGPQKKGRGRPRKYPPAPPPLVKRPRGRPRLNPIVPQEDTKQENYDISNMPYGDLEYLTKPLEETSDDLTIDDQDLMEPLVEIKTEPSDKNEPEKTEKTGTFLENIGLFENSAVAKIGECTISVANNSGAT